jgi:hypothetical protein
MLVLFGMVIPPLFNKIACSWIGRHLAYEFFGVIINIFVRFSKGRPVAGKPDQFADQVKLTSAI